MHSTSMYKKNYFYIENNVFYFRLIYKYLTGLLKKIFLSEFFSILLLTEKNLFLVSINK